MINEVRTIEGSAFFNDVSQIWYDAEPVIVVLQKDTGFNKKTINARDTAPDNALRTMANSNFLAKTNIPIMSIKKKLNAKKICHNTIHHIFRFINN
jgi:predicted transcriptional regulator